MSPALGKFYQRNLQPCPTCGKAQEDCAAVPEEPRDRGAPSPYRSRESVWSEGYLEYGVGATVPLVEALRQGLVSVPELSENQRTSLREHADRDPVVRSALLALRRKGK